ncbi:MAG TPA: hypothetical protein PLW50_00650 [Smithellaceae bacterium]|nr:hypothetical protein [Smithellaceae bacterium]
MELSEVGTIVGISCAIIGLLIEHFHFNAQVQDRLARLETKVDLFWSALGQQLAPMLLRGNPIAADSPLAQLIREYHTQSQHPRCSCIMPKEHHEDLIKLLEVEVNDFEKDHDASERLVMAMLLAVLKTADGGA